MRTRVWLLPALLVTVLLGVLPSSAAAKKPSASCNDGALLCRDAWAKLDACEQANPEKKNACASERRSTDAACRESSRTCHTDGSRRASK